MNAVRTAAMRLRRFWIDHLWADSIIAIAIVGTHILLLFPVPELDLFGNALPADRRGVYTSAAVVVSLLGSLSAVAIGQLGSASGARARALREQAADILARNWRSVFRTGLLAALVALVALLLDPSIHVTTTTPVIVRWVFEFTLVLAVVKFSRLSALFYEVLSIKAQSEADPAEERELAAAPKIGPRWRRSAA